MARIRSIHPGLFTDESYMALSLGAKAVWPGIWTEADDHGVLEWKPLTLKARLLPADNVDMVALMVEMVDGGLLLRFTVDGKQFAAIKGFLKWQRPKEPRYRFPFPHEAKDFANNCTSIPPALPKDFPNTPPIAPQREEEGGKREEVTNPNGLGADAPDPVKVLFDEGVELLTSCGSTERAARTIVGKWRKERGNEAVFAAFKACRAAGATEPIAWVTTFFAQSGKPRENWNDRRIREGHEAIDKALAEHH